MSHSSAGKGDDYRKVDPKKYSEGYDMAFGTIRHWTHGGCGEQDGHFSSLSLAGHWCREAGYTLEWKKANSEFVYFDQDGTEIGGFYRGSL
jgi:hypothetical protein